MSEENDASKILPTQPGSSAHLVDIVRYQFCSIPGVVENTVIHLFGDAARETESNQDANVLSLILTVVNRTSTKDSRGSSFQVSVERAVQKDLAELHVANNLATRTINLLAFRVLVSKVDSNEVKKRFLQQGKMDQ